MKHKESDLQIRCVKWFRYQYPQYARLLEHPKNEGCGNRRQGAIAKAEGVQPGVADLILHVPAYWHDERGVVSTADDTYHSLALELKTKTNSQMPSQRQWQFLFEAAGGKYVIIRSYEEFVSEVTKYMFAVPMHVSKRVYKAYAELEREAEEKTRKEFLNLLHPELSTAPVGSPDGK